jgi:hypothetical protein
MDKTLHEGNSSDVPQYLLQSVLSPLLRTGTTTNSFYWAGNSSLFKMGLMSLWIWDSNVLPPA